MGKQTILYKRKIQTAQLGFGISDINKAVKKNTSVDFKAMSNGTHGVNMNSGTTEGQNTKSLATADLALAKTEHEQGMTDGGSVNVLSPSNVAKPVDALKEAQAELPGLVKTSQASLDGATSPGDAVSAGGIKPMSAVGQAGVGAAAGVAEMGASMLTEGAGIDYDDLDKGVNQGKIAMGGAVSGAAKGAQMGMAFGPWGAAIGGVVGGAAGYFGGKKKAKEEEEKRNELVVKRDLGIMDKHQAENADESNRLAAEVSGKYSKTGRAIVARQGTKFAVHIDKYILPLETGPIKKLDRKEIVVFKSGGRMTELKNIIPNGVSHEEKNKMGTKGMPVVKCTTNYCSKVYEIESDELIITKKVTKEIEKLSKENKLEELGNFFAGQIVNNTHSFTDKYAL